MSGGTLAKFAQYLVANRPAVLAAIGDHVTLLVLVPVSLAVLVAVPLGIMATRYRWLEAPVMGLASVIQTIPSLALLALLIVAGTGLGYRTAVIALFLYSLLPILRNTYTGIKGVDAFIKEAATGMGMTDLQRLVKVELPMAVPVIMAGIRTATVIAIGTGTLAALVGAGGLGPFIVRGLNLMRDHLVLVGAVPAAAMALLADFLLGRLEAAVVPRGLKQHHRQD